jgi:hypothetical protein
MIKTILQEFPITDYPRERSLSEEKIRKYAYTKEEVNFLIEAAVKEAVDEARRIDDESMAKHKMHLDVNILDKIETDIIDRIKQVPIQKILQQGFR